MDSQILFYPQINCKVPYVPESEQFSLAYNKLVIYNPTNPSPIFFSNYEHLILKYFKKGVRQCSEWYVKWYLFWTLGSFNVLPHCYSRPEDTKPALCLCQGMQKPISGYILCHWTFGNTQSAGISETLPTQMEHIIIILVSNVW